MHRQLRGPLSALLPLLLGALLGTVGPGRAASPADSTHLIARASALFPFTPSTEAELARQRAALLALADSLEAAGLAGPAGRAYEWAGIHAFRFGHLEDAQATWRQGLAMVRRHQHPKMEVSLLNAIAVGQAAAGRSEEAATSWLELLPLREALQDSFGLGVTWGNIANAYKELGRVGEALEATLHAERWDGLAGNLSGRLATLMRRTELMAQLGRHAEALAWADSALALARRSDKPDALGLALVRQAAALEALGRGEEALPQLEAGIAGLNAAGDHYYAAICQETRLRLLLGSGRAAECLAAARQLQPTIAALAHGPLLNALRACEAEALLALGRRAEAQAILTEVVAAFEAERVEQVAPGSRAGLQRQGAPYYSALARCQLRDSATAAAWATLERGRAPLFRERLGQARPITLVELQVILEDDRATLIQYDSFTGNGLLAFLVDGQSLQVLDLALEPDLEADARAALSLMASGSSDGRCQPPLARLAAQLIAPLLDLLPAGRERLYLIPPDALAGFPFEALPAADSALGARFATSYLPSASALGLLGRRPAASSGMLALADPPPASGAPGAGLADASRGLAGLSLPEARGEVRDIAVAGSLRLMGRAARTLALDTAAPDCAVLHFATHALINPLNGADAALLLAGPTGGSEFLRAAEVESLRLAADLVTLSACRSSLGLVLPGEGSFGLPRSFLLAGGRSVVSSLWDVEDRAARRFMIHFYAALRRGEERDQALRSARLALAAEGYPLRDRAAFILTGLGAGPVAALAGASSAAPVPRGALLLAGAATLLLPAAVLIQRRRRGRSRSLTK